MGPGVYSKAGAVDIELKLKGPGSYPKHRAVGTGLFSSEFLGHFSILEQSVWN